MGILDGLFGEALSTPTEVARQQGLQEAQGGQTYITTSIGTSSIASQLQAYWPYSQTGVPLWEPIITFESLAPLAVTHNPSKTVLFVWEP